jgi:hypothetical protein
VSLGAAVGFAGTAFAAGNPPWEPVANPPEVGSLQFFNAAGQQITGGNLTDSPIAAYVEGTSTIRSGDTKATLFAYTPVNGVAPGAWSGEQLGSSSYPNSSAPAPLKTSALPVESGASGDLSIAQYALDFPNSDTSTTDGYGNTYVLRLKTNYAGGSTTSSYDSADIQVNSSAGTWSVVYPAPTLTSTTTTLTTTQSSPQVSGTSVQLNAAVSPSASGTVQFEVGGTNIGSPITVSNGTASISTSSLPVGTDSLSAVFTPAQFSAYTGSTGTDSFTVTPPPAAATTTGLSVNPTSAAADQTVTLTGDVTVTSTSSPLSTGTISFYDIGSSTTDSTTGGQMLGTVPVNSSGVATLGYAFTTAAAHNLVAQYTSADQTVDANSTSQVVDFTTTAPTYAPANAGLTVGIPAGTLTITTPYSAASPFSLGTATLDANGDAFHASAAFGNATTPSNGVTITDTRAGDLPWSASAEVSNFSDGAVPTPDLINGQNLAFTGVTPSYLTGNALQSVLTYANTSAATTGTPYGAGASGNDGLAGTAHQFASATAGEGSVYIDGLLTLTAPTSTAAGTYTATLTFTIS